jgi:type I restriction enzyme, S subunit
VKLPAYPRTKSSAVEWLGDVPEHWQTLALKRRFHVVNGGTPSSSEDSYWEGEIPWFTPEDLGRIETKVIASSRRQITKDGLANCGASLSPRGSVLISTRAPIGHVAVMGVDGCCNQGCRILVPEGSKVSADFGYYVVVASNAVLNSVGKGTTFLELSAGALGAHFIPLPDPSEQRAIAAFLDRETGRLDRLMGKKRELIERLKEKRTALISRTVTRGLPPAAARAAGLPANPPLKPSGVPWFDEYPSHWQTKRLRHISNFIVVGVVVNPSSYVTDEGVVFLLGGDVREMRIDTTDCKRCSPESSNGPLVKSRLDAGDLVVVRVGYPGVAAVVPPELAGGNVASMMLVRKHPRYCSQWLAYAFNSQVGRDQVEIVQYGAAQKQFNISHAVDFAFPFPPLPEQAAIAAYLDLETAKLDALVGKVELAVERLQEHRTALITAAVTGKIDVRKEVAP